DCRAPEAMFNVELEVEHVAARARGGADTLENLALACRSCNSRKGTASTARDPLTGRVVPLFDPRTEDWGSHFHVNLRSFRIEGLSAIGRATVRRLGMNRPLALRARRAWVTRLLVRF